MVSITPTASTNNQCVLLRLYEEAAEGMDMYTWLYPWRIELFSDASVEWPVLQRSEESLLVTRLDCLLPLPVVCGSWLAVVGGQLNALQASWGPRCVCRARPPM